MNVRRWVGLFCLLALISGCSRDDTVHLSGTLKYSDGSPVVASLVSITFTPTGSPPASGPVPYTVSASVDPDGTYLVRTNREASGMIPGDYVATVRAQKDYTSPNQVADKFANVKTSPLKVTVGGSGVTTFDIVVEKAAAK